MSLDTSAASYLFKQMYEDGPDPKALVRNKPLLASCPNDTDFTSPKGKSLSSPYVNPQGGATTNATAFANEASGKGVEFIVPQRSYTWGCVIDGNVVRNAANGGDASQLADALEREVDGATEAIGAELHRQAYGDKTGVRAYVHATTAPSGAVLTLANPEDAQLFFVGMYVQGVDGSGTLRDSGDRCLISKVDAIAGTLETSTGNWTTVITGLTTGDGLIREGDLNAVADGLRGWVPATVGGADSFNGVNRSVNRALLAGVYADVSALPIRNAFIKALAMAKAQVGPGFGKGPIYLNPKNFAQVLMSVEGARAVSTNIETEYGIAVEAIECMGHKFIEDAVCPVDEFFMFPEGGFTRGSCGKQPALDNVDGLDMYYNRRTGKLEFSLQHDGNFYPTGGKTAQLLRGKLAAIAG